MKNQNLIKVLIEPRVTEKSTVLADKQRQFVFKVAPDASKPDVKKAVESMFEVQVESVRICKVKGKRKVFRGAYGRRSGWKKAYVSLKPGFDINFSGTP